MVQGTGLSWYAVRVQSKYEGFVSSALREKGYEEFLPRRRNLRQWSDRVKVSESPLFPGYLFCRFTLESRILPILTTPHVLSIVGVGKTPVPVPDEEIESIQVVVRSGLVLEPVPFLAVGDRVLIEEGPLAGIEGVVTSADKKFRLVVSVSLLQRSVAVEIDRQSARRLTAPGPRPLAVAEGSALLRPAAATQS